MLKFRETLYFLFKFTMSRISRCFLNKYESKILKQNYKLNHKKSGKKIILLEGVKDYYFLLFYKFLILKNFKENRIFITWPYYFGTRPENKNIKYYLSLFLNYLEDIKWKKLYRSLGVEKFIYPSIAKKNTQLYIKAIKIIQECNTKNKVLKIKINNILVGDLIYDTYLRFARKPTLKLDDKFLIFIVYKTLIVFKNLNQIKKNFYIDKFFTNYSSYIHHGIAVRFFLKKKIKTYACVQQPGHDPIKKLSLHNFNHTKNFIIFKKFFKTLKDQNKCLAIGKNILLKKISGKKNNKNIFTSGYAFSGKEFLNNQKNRGILFLHDFFDAPHDFKFFVFPDYYEWTDFTLKFISEHNLKISIKPHPKSSKDSFKIIEMFKKKYSNLNWIHHETSNLSIFKNKYINFGISIHGQVLYEMAYFGIFPINLSVNPITSFDISKPVRNKNKYKKQILYRYYKNLRSKFKLNDIYKIMYLYMEHNNYLFSTNKLEDLNIRKSADLDVKTIWKNNNKIINL